MNILSCSWLALERTQITPIQSTAMIPQRIRSVKPTFGITRDGWSEREAFHPGSSVLPPDELLDVIDAAAEGTFVLHLQARHCRSPSGGLGGR